MGPQEVRICARAQRRGSIQTPLENHPSCKDPRALATSPFCLGSEGAKQMASGFWVTQLGNTDFWRKGSRWGLAFTEAKEIPKGWHAEFRQPRERNMAHEKTNTSSVLGRFSHHKLLYTDIPRPP